MSTQITVRLPDDLVAEVDEFARTDTASRATIVARALRLYRQQRAAERDAAELERTGDYDDFDALPGFVAPLDLDD